MKLQDWYAGLAEAAFVRHAIHSDGERFARTRRRRGLQARRDGLDPGEILAAALDAFLGDSDGGAELPDQADEQQHDGGGAAP